MEWAMRRLLVTGGAGFIGSNFIRYWLSRHPDNRIVNLDKLTYAGDLENLAAVESHPSYRFVQGDICDFSLLDALFRSENINFVIHFAAESHVDRSILGAEAFIRTNVHGTFTLLEAVRRYWKSGVNEEYRFLHISSDEVYGSMATGGNIRDWLYVEDHCAALEAVLERGRIGERYNIGGGNQLRNIDVVHLICDLLDEKLALLPHPRRSLVTPVEDRPGHDWRYAMDNSKISRQLDWQPRESFETGLVKTTDWYLRHPTWVQRVMTGEYQGYFAAQYGSRLGRK